MAKTFSRKQVSNKNKNNKAVEIVNLPSLRSFGDNTPIVSSIERGQIDRIKILVDKKEIEIYKNGEFVPGIHPNQKDFIFNAIVGGSGTARGARQLGFAHWVTSVMPMFNQIGFNKPIGSYKVIVDYSKRGGKMIFPLDDLVKMCVMKTNAAIESYKLFPRTQKPLVEAREPKVVEVSVTL